MSAIQATDLVRRFGEAVISIETPSGKGSGFILNEEGFAVTNHHVIDGETRVSKVVEAAAKEAGKPIKVTGFVRMQLGEGIDKPTADLAAEVAATLKG